jgi:hypothetical protein
MAYCLPRSTSFPTAPLGTIVVYPGLGCGLSWLGSDLTRRGHAAILQTEGRQKQEVTEAVNIVERGRDSCNRFASWQAALSGTKGTEQRSDQEPEE